MNLQNCRLSLSPVKIDNKCKFGLSHETIAQICGVFDSFPEVDAVKIYGSRAKGNYRRGSDIDLTFTGQDIDLKLINKISCRLDDLLLPYSFDLSIMSHISNQDLINHINRVGMMFYKRRAES